MRLMHLSLLKLYQILNNNHIIGEWFNNVSVDLHCSTDRNVLFLQVRGGEDARRPSVVRYFVNDL